MKRFSIYHFLVAIMAFSLMMPAAVTDAKASGETGSLTIHKFEQEKGTEQGEGDGKEITGGIDGTALPGVEFTLTQTHKYDPSTDKWSKVTDNPKTYVERTNGNGQIVISDIDLGRYTVQETDGPAHVVLNKKEYSVDIPMTSQDGTDVNYDVHVYPKNETVRGEVKLTKYDGDTKEKLAGVTFTLFKKDGTEVEAGLKTNADGTITVENLAYGEYYFQETATIDGYLLNGKKVDFKIKTSDAGKTVKVKLDNYKKPEIEKEVSEPTVNRGETVTYTITVDLPGDIAEYDDFKITDTLHENLSYVAGSESGATGFTFAQDGQTLTWTADPAALSPGTVKITFDAIISEDAIANEPIDNEASIDYNNGYVSGGDKDNVPVLPTAGTLKVLKKDGDTKATLDGAVFELRDLDGNVVKTGTTNNNGIIDFGEVDYGEYKLVETKAPEGYSKLRNPIDVTVNEANNEQTITVDNYKSGWELPKTGGIGSLLFTLAGLILMGTAAFMFIRRRRKEIA